MLFNSLRKFLNFILEVSGFYLNVGASLAGSKLRAGYLLMRLKGAEKIIKFAIQAGYIDDDRLLRVGAVTS